MAKKIKFFLLLFLVCSFYSGQILAQNEPDYDEISVFFSVPRIGGTDISAVIRGEAVYLPITEMFGFLKIKNTSSPGYDTIKGFLINEQGEYLIERQNNRITYKNRVVKLNPGDLIRTETDLYLKSNYFGEIFDLFCVFNFRALTISLNTTVELPIIREMRLEQMRKNLNQLKGDIKADTTYERRFPFLRMGMADWTVLTNYDVGKKADTRLSLDLGTVIAGGEANANLNYSTTQPFDEKQQYYSWRYVNNNYRGIRQVTIGKLNTESVSSLTSPIIGFKISNTPTTYRGSFGTYTLSDFTEPNWTVELYVNNVLIDYKKADASGFFKFQVPMVYGNTSVKLQFYGPWGEERSKEQEINIPYNFLPKGSFEYVVTGGVVEDSTLSKFSRADLNYGITRYLTIGAGVEYLSSIATGATMPFVNTSFRVGSIFLVSGEYTHNVRTRGVLNLRLPADIQFEIDYSKYKKGQTAINNNYLEERKASLSIPFQANHLNLYTRLSVSQMVMALSNYTTSEFLISGSLYGINCNITTSGLFTSHNDPNYYSNVSVSVMLPGHFIFSPQTQYNYSEGKFVSAKASLEKRVFKKGYLSLSYEKNIRNNFQNIEVGFRYDFSFAQLGVTGRRSDNTNTITGNASGSFLLDPKTRYLGASSRASVSKGGISIFPYLDLNNNNKYDKNEPKAYGMQIHINGGRTEFYERDTTIRVFDLEPYTNYLLTLDGSNFDNISWQIKHKTLSVAVDPNQFKHIEIPISVMGEVSGMVYMGKGSSLSGQGRINVNFYTTDSLFVSKTLSESDGYFSYLGLKPGSYIARIDPVQMSKLNMTATPSVIPFIIKKGLEGDVVDGMEFVIRSNSTEPDTNAVTPPVEVKTAKQIINKEIAQQIAPKPAAEPVAKGSVKQSEKRKGAFIYRVQILAVKKQVNIKEFFKDLQNELSGLVIEEIFETDGLYHYCSQPIDEWVKCVKLQRLIRSKGWKDSFVSFYIDSKRTDSNVENSTQQSEQSGYRIQFLAVSAPVNINTYFASLLTVMPGIKIIETKGADGIYRYSTLTFRTLSQTRAILNEIKLKGVKIECFIAVYKP